MDKRTLNQLYLENIPGKITVGAYIRRTSDVTRNNYIPEFELQEIAKQNGRAVPGYVFALKAIPRREKLYPEAMR